MIVIVEGIDKTGKTTLIERLEEKGFISVKDSSPRARTPEEEAEKLFTYVSVISHIGVRHDVAVDRCHGTESVYGFLDRGYLSNSVLEVDLELARNPEVVLVIMIREDTTNIEGRDLSRHQICFVVFGGQLSKIGRVIFGELTTIDKVIDAIMQYKAENEEALSNGLH